MNEFGPALNYKKSEQVWDNYHKTIFSLMSVSQELRQSAKEATELMEKVRQTYGVTIFL